jgi:outer membrane lipoprotein LolB
MKSFRPFAIVVLASLPSACAMQPVKRSAPVEASSNCPSVSACAEARETAVWDSNVWSLTGRIAVTNGRDGGSGRIEWSEDDEFFSVVFSAPITRQSWRLSMDETGATLTGLKGGPRTGSDPAALVRDATGWEIPIDAMTAWVRGVPASDTKPAAAQYDALGRLSHLEEQGWVIDYGWPDAPTTDPVMPSRIEAVRGTAKVRLVVDTWTLGASAP